MNFWENVEFELDKQGKYKKELALAVGINASNFDKGKSRNSIPAADKALKISRFLGIPLETLLGMECKKTALNPKILELEKTLSNLNEDDISHISYIARRLEEKSS